MIDSREHRIECPRQHAHHLLFSWTESGDIAIKCRGCHEVYTLAWTELESKRQQLLAQMVSLRYTLSQ